METDDASLLSVALPGRTTLGGSCRRSDTQKRRPSLSVENNTHGGGGPGDGGGGVVGGGGGCGAGVAGNVEGSDGAESKGGDIGRLWMAENGGYLCVDLLLERTLIELAEGLHFAIRCVEGLRGTTCGNITKDRCIRRRLRPCGCREYCIVAFESAVVDTSPRSLRRIENTICLVAYLRAPVV